MIFNRINVFKDLQKNKKIISNSKTSHRILKKIIKITNNILKKSNEENVTILK
jgi:hypothetical protein